MLEIENLNQAETALLRATDRMGSAGLNFGMAVQQLERLLADAFPNEDQDVVPSWLEGLDALPQLMVTASKDIERAFGTVADTTRRLIAHVEQQSDNYFDPPEFPESF